MTDLQKAVLDAGRKSFLPGSKEASENGRKGGIKSGESRRLQRLIVRYGRRLRVKAQLPDGAELDMPLEQVVFCVDLWEGARRELRSGKASAIPKTELLLKLMGVDPALLSKSVDVTTGGEPFRGFGAALPVIPGIEEAASEIDRERRGGTGAETETEEG